MITELTGILTAVSAVAATLMLALVIYGFRRYIKRPRFAPIDYIATGIWLMALAKLTRLLWWDVVPYTFLPNLTDFRVAQHEVNWIFDLLVVLACWYMLKGIHIMVEAKEPGKYNVFTAVFYPKRLRMWISSRAEEMTDDTLDRRSEED